MTACEKVDVVLCGNNATVQKFLHIRSHDGNTSPFQLTVLKLIRPFEFNLRPRLKSTSLGPDKDVLGFQREMHNNQEEKVERSMRGDHGEINVL